MKTLFIFLICSITIVNIACAQIKKESEKSYPFPAGKKVVLDVPFAKKITVKTWNKQEVLFKTNLTADDEAVAKLHEMEANESTDALRIKTDYADSKSKNRNFCGCENDRNNNGWNCLCLEVSHELFVPTNTILKIETINGDIEISGLESEMNINTINGFVDVTYGVQAKATIQFSTINGDIYSDFDINKQGNMQKFSKNVKTQLNGGGAPLVLETINGDIFLEKQSSEKAI